MAPELIRVRSRSAKYHISKTQDVWSFGIVMFAVLFNDLPWEKASDTDADFVDMMRAGGMTQGLPQKDVLSIAMQQLMCGMLAVDPADRIGMHEVCDFLSESTAWLAVDDPAPVLQLPPVKNAPVLQLPPVKNATSDNSAASKHTEWAKMQSHGRFVESFSKESHGHTGDGHLSTAAWSNFRTVGPERLTRKHEKRRRSSSLSGLGSMKSLLELPSLDFTASHNLHSLTGGLAAANIRSFGAHTRTPPASQPGSRRGSNTRMSLSPIDAFDSKLTKNVSL